MLNEIKLCECGCGNPAPIVNHTDRRLGNIKGQPCRFISGHNGCLHRPSGCVHEPKHAKGLCMNCYSAAHYAANAQARLEQNRIWRKNNPERCAAQQHRHKARIKANGGVWTAEEWQGLKQRHNNSCVGCGKTESELGLLNRLLVPDHIVPLVKGGLNSIENLQPLCHCRAKGSRGGCNNIKGRKIKKFI